MLRIWQKLKEIFNLNPCLSKKIFILQIFYSIINHSFTSSELNHMLELIFWWDVGFFNWNLAKKCFLHWIEIPGYFQGSRERWLTFPEIPGSQKVREILVSIHSTIWRRSQICNPNEKMPQKGGRKGSIQIQIWSVALFLYCVFVWTVYYLHAITKPFLV